MQVLKSHKFAVIITVLLIIILAVSIAVLVQNMPQPSPTPTPTPAASPSPSPTSTANTPTSKPASSPTTLVTTPPAPLLPGEVAQYEGQNLTPVNQYITYLNAHPDVAIKGAQYIDQASYRLAITGLVNQPSNYSYDQIVDGFNSSLQVATLPCVEGWSVTLLWQGVPIMDILNQTGVNSDANTLIFVANDGYSSSLPLQYVRDNNIMIAYKMNNVTFSPQLGWPFFLAAKGQYGYKWVEWVTEINVSNDSNYHGYWESRGYPNNATVPNAGVVGQPGDNIPVVLAVLAVSAVSAAFATVVYYRRHEKRRQIDGKDVTAVMV